MIGVLEEGAVWFLAVAVVVVLWLLTDRDMRDRRRRYRRRRAHERALRSIQ